MNSNFKVMNLDIIALLIALVCVISLLNGVDGHSYLTNPLSRGNQKQSNAGCRGPSCIGPCDKPKDSVGKIVKVETVQRGQSIKLEWPRNNHAGGFIRVAWAPTTNSDSHEAFDAGVQIISCHERGGCKPRSATDLNGGDDGPADGSSNACSLTINVPNHLTDGSWTLQWAWFGGAFALGDYYSCVDYIINGGNQGVSVAPYFLGGDYTYPNQQKCKYFNTDRLRQCVNEPCNAPLKSGEQSGLPFGFTSSSSNNNNNNAPTPTPAPITSSKIPVPNVPVPNVPAPNIPVSMTTGKTANGNNNNNNNNNGNPSTSIGTICASEYDTLSQSTAQIVSVDTWGNTFRMVIQVTAKELLNDWSVQIIYPSSAINSKVEAVFNSATFLCESISPVRHAIVKSSSWVKTLYPGSVATIEVISTNTNMNKQFIMSNVQLKVLTKN